MAEVKPIVVQFDLRYDQFAAWSSIVYLVGFAVGRLTHLSLAVPFGLAIGYVTVVTARRLRRNT